MGGSRLLYLADLRPDHVYRQRSHWIGDEGQYEVVALAVVEESAPDSMLYWVYELDQAAREVEDSLYLELDSAMEFLKQLAPSVEWDRVHVAEADTLRFVQEWLGRQSAPAS